VVVAAGHVKLVVGMASKAAVEMGMAAMAAVVDA
jgi:hypothetical protein